MDITLEGGSGPAYRQIVEKIRSMILGGELPPGTSLPSVRSLASSLGTSSLTVHHAYQQLGRLGLVESRPRQATRVAVRIAGSTGRAMLDRLPQQGPVSSFEMLAEASGVRSMASSVGDPALFFADEFLAEIDRLRHDSPWNFYYSEPAGTPELLTQIAHILSRDVLPSDESDLVITGGSTRALSLLLEVATEPGDTVLVQEPGRLWLPELLRANRLVGVPIRSAGSSIDLGHAVHCASQYRPRILLVSPDFGHATGLAMPEAERLACIRLARDAGMLIVEDGACSALRFGPRAEPAIASVDPAVCAYAGSFSYSLCPGVRTGFLRVPAALRPALVAASQATGVSGARFLQLALARYLASGAYDAHLRRVVPRYRARRDAMLAALRLAMPASVSWTEPAGGLSAWLTLGAGASSSELYARALKQGIAFAPGKLFLTAADPERHLRLSYGIMEPEGIREAVRELGRLADRMGPV